MIELWDISGTCIQTLSGHRDLVRAISFSSNGQLLASGGRDRTIRLWNESGTCLQVILGHINTINVVVFSSDGGSLISGSDDRTIKVWTQDGTYIETLAGHKSSVNCLSLTSDSCILASGASDHSVRLWHRKQGGVTTLIGHTNKVVCISFSPDDRYLVSASMDDTIRLWNKSGVCLRILDDRLLDLWSVIWLPDNQHIISSSGGMIKLWNSDGACLKTFKAGRKSFDSLVYVDDRNLVAMTSDSNQIEYWDISRQPLNSVPAVSGNIYAVGSSLDGQLLATSHCEKPNYNTVAEQIAIWKGDGNHLKSFPVKGLLPNIILFSPDSRFLVSEDSQISQAKLWDLSGKCLLAFESRFSCMAFSSDSKLFLAATVEGFRLWDCSGKCLDTITGNRQEYHHLAFSSDNNQVVFAMFAKRVSVWDRAKASMTSFRVSGSPIHATAFCFDDQCIALATQHPQVQIWNTKGNLLQIIRFDSILSRLDLDVGDPTGRSFVTNRGKLCIKKDRATWHGYGVNRSDTWVTFNGENVLWIPPDYRRWLRVTVNSVIMVGFESTRPALLLFTGEPPIADWG